MMKKKTILFTALLLLIFVTGCAGKEKPAANLADHMKNLFGNKPKIEQKERLDQWSPTMKLSDCAQEELVLPAAEAKAVPVTFTEEEKKDEWDSYTGGADAEYATAQADASAPDEVKRLISEYNDWVIENTDSEMKAAKERWDLYHAVDPDDFIALTPRVGMHLMRSDTSVFSYMTEIYCYNRDYEPDLRLLYGYTFDAQSGRELTLRDFINDTDAMTDLICQSLKITNSSYREEATNAFVADAFRQRVKESLDGCRDDGLFAWTLDPAGFEFYFADPFFESEYLMHSVERAFVPFSLCRDLLFQDADVSYDHIVNIPFGYVEKLYGFRTLPGMKENGYYSAYLVHKSGQDYLYLSGYEETLVYRIEDQKPEYLTSVIGEPANTEYSAYAIFPDPASFTMDYEACLVREMNELSAQAYVGEDGVPVYAELFRSPYFLEPMSVIEPFEAEVFTDEKDEEPEIRELPQNTWLNFLRTDGQTFIDLYMEGTGQNEQEEICRFYVTGDRESGFSVNGHPVDEVLNLKGWLEE